MRKGRTYKNFLFTLTLISTGPPFVLIFFSVIVVFLHTSGQLSHTEDLREIFLYMVPAFTIAGLSAAYLIYKYTIGKINPALSLHEKLIKYQSACMVRMALLEAVGLVAAVATFLTGYFYFLICPLLIVIIFILLRPSVYGITEDLNLTQDEKGKLEGKDAFIPDIE